MSVEISGLNELLEELDKKLGTENMQRISDEALKKGADIFVAELKSQFQSFKDTGASIDEITVSDPLTVSGSRTIKIHWKGPKGRYRIVHLNEWGTVNNPNPKGKGAIARALRNAEKSYREAIIQAVKEGI